MKDNATRSFQEPPQVPDQAADALPPEMTEETEPVFMAEPSRPGRSGNLLLVGLLIVGAGVLYFMHLRAGPRAAAAAESKAATATIGEFLNGGTKNIQGMRELLTSTERVVQQFSLASGRLEGALVLKTNPFLFATASDPAPEDPNAAGRRQIEEEKRRKQQILTAVQQLQLQSIMTGKTPTCMISGRACQEGQEIDGFLIERITRNSVIVKQSNYRFELRMQR